MISWELVARAAQRASAPDAVMPVEMVDFGHEISAMAMNGPPPFTGIGGVAPMFPGSTNWAEFDFAPGEYVANCFVPDPAAGAPHFALGMIMPISVV